MSFVPPEDLVTVNRVTAVTFLMIVAFFALQASSAVANEIHPVLQDVDSVTPSAGQLPALFTIRLADEDLPDDSRQRDIDPERERSPSLWSVRDVLFGRETPVVTSLLDRGGAVVVRPVRTLSIPTPLAMLGNPAAWSTRFRAAYGSNLDGRNMIYGNVILNTKGSVGIDAEFSRRDDGRAILSDPEFWLGDANVVYRMSQIRNVILRVGAGVNWLNDGNTSEIGFNTTYGFDVYLTKPWLISTTVDWGTLGSETLWHWQLTAGLDFGRFELFVGYDFHQIGRRERKNLIAGAGLWF